MALIYDNLFIQQTRLINEFNALISIGHGGFGEVFRAQHRVDEKEYAIKKIAINGLEDYNIKIRELKVWAKLETEYFVQYKSSWLELDQEQRILHIQMELCWFTLDEVIGNAKESFDIGNTRLLLPGFPVLYYITSQLLIEILESIAYLHHTCRPAILHRDVKPTNILIKQGINGRFVKLADFGLSVEHRSDSQSHSSNTGSIKYMAPEVVQGRHYDTSADVYSIGVMIKELFNFDINIPVANLPQNYRSLIEMTARALNGQRRQRLTCIEMLAIRDQWALDFNDVQERIVAHLVDLNIDYNYQVDFVRYFLKTKYTFNVNNA